MQLKVSIEKIFVIFALFFGILYAFITPPFQSVDEANHFLRSYAVTQGQIISTKKGGCCRKCLTRIAFRACTKI